MATLRGGRGCHYGAGHCPCGAFMKALRAGRSVTGALARRKARLAVRAMPNVGAANQGQWRAGKPAASGWIAYVRECAKVVQK